LSQPEFDSYADGYQERLREPIRDRFARDPRFFTERKWILIREFLTRTGRDTASMSWLDVGCGEGDLLRLGEHSFARVAGCDVSPEMLNRARGLDIRIQSSETQLPFGDHEFDFTTAVCVFHHVPPARRLALILEMKRILRPGGVICLIEHNAQNPVVRGMVRRIPVDVNAVLLEQRECHDLFRGAQLRSVGTEFFLYLPETLFRVFAALETLGRKIPLGGQFAAFGMRPA
jgi:ubiquinone/menaquinone biosynthesis C-methylase UbiE